MARLIKRTIDAAQPKKARYDLWDDDLPGFAIRIFPSGVRSFFVFYRNAAGDARRLTIGRYGAPFTVDQARAEARRLMLAAKTGGDPAAARTAQREAPRVDELVKEYRAQRVPGMKPTTQRSEAHLLDKHVLPRFERRTVASLARHDVEQLKVEMRETPGAANKVLGILSRLCAYAEDLGWRPAGSNPTRGVKRNGEKKIERFLTPDERARLERVFRAAERAKVKTRGRVDATAVACFRLLALTGMRLGEALDLRWRDVDLEHRRLTLPTSKTGHKYVRLSAQAAALLESLPDEHELVFSKSGGARLDNMQRRWIAIRKAAALPELRIHDLRHAWASDAVMAGVPLHIVGKQLGHASPSTTHRYAHLSGDVVADAVDKVGAVIAEKTRGGNARAAGVVAGSKRSS